MVSNFYVDTSALAKRYLNEQGAAWTLSWIEPDAGNTIIISKLAEVEMFSLFARRVREGSLSSEVATNLEADFLYHGEHEYLITPIEDPIMVHARELTKIRQLRALDAIQLATAIHVKTYLDVPLIFISADVNLLTAAASEGFSTDNPNAHS